MRAGPLSDDKIIKILNRYFVPFYTSYEDYEKAEGGVSKEESTVFNGLMKRFYDAKFETGLVFVYVFNANLVPLGTLHVAKAQFPDVLEKFLSDFVSRLHITGGEPSFKPRPQSVPPPAGKDSLVLHVFIRGITIEPKFPHEDWIVLSRDELRRLLPPPSSAGHPWRLDEQVAAKFGGRLHPTLEWLDNHDGYTVKIDRLNLQAAPVASSGEFKIARIEGKLRMLRTAFSYAPEKSHVSANLSGYLKYNDRTVLSLEIAVQDAFYGDGSLDDKEFEGYVESRPGSEPRQLQERFTSSH
jgi:hypothetical protein